MAMLRRPAAHHGYGISDAVFSFVAQRTKRRAGGVSFQLPDRRHTRASLCPCKLRRAQSCHSRSLHNSANTGVGSIPNPEGRGADSSLSDSRAIAGCA